jgi:2-oxoglutarate dehydrogenase E2 component (dihydrolipoamide succinyltransferase)
VERDEEIATIETDKVSMGMLTPCNGLINDWVVEFQIDVSVNAPDSGTIKELLVKEEDTVTVGQDIVRLELGSAKGKDAGEPSKEPSAPETPPSTGTEKKKTEQPEPRTETAQPPPSKNVPPSRPKPEAVPQKQGQVQPSQEPPHQPRDQITFGNREERRVCPLDIASLHSRVF